VDQRTLVERAREGDREAFAVLARASAARLDAAARLILRDREHARDAVQEALIRAWRDLPGLRDPDRFDAWLYRLLSNAAIDEARRRKRRVIEVKITLADMGAVHEDPTGRLADRDALDRALAGLSPEHRALVVLHYYVGLPLPEAAAALGISLGAAKSRLHRAIGTLRRSFTSDEDAALAAAARGGQP
jgi:RNA polymerase sigma-70 factor, ECF subfamily